jgi:hypothetical protein
LGLLSLIELFLTATICRCSNSVALIERGRSAARASAPNIAFRTARQTRCRYWRDFGEKLLVWFISSLGSSAIILTVLHHIGVIMFDLSATYP